jgi:hypothetical protein
MEKIAVFAIRMMHLLKRPRVSGTQFAPLTTGIMPDQSEAIKGS